MPKTLTDSDAENEMMKANGENWNRASKAMWPSMLNSSRPKKSSALAPNWAVFEVTAK